MATFGNSHPSGKGMSRIGTSGLKVRTNNFTDVSSFKFKAQAIASADWRKTASGTSSSGNSFQQNAVAKMRRDERTSSGTSSLFMVEMDEISPHAVLHRPKEEPAPWEMVVSAPGAAMPQSPSTLHKQVLSEAVAVRLEDMKPMTVNINGEEIALKNNFAFDISPIGLADCSYREIEPRAFGFMKRITSPTKFRRRSSLDSGLLQDLPADLRAMLNRDKTAVGLKESSRHCKVEQFSPQNIRVRTDKDAAQLGSFDSGIDITGRASYENVPYSVLQGVREDNEERFQSLLRRLRRPLSVIQGNPNSIPDIQATDPAIITAKVKGDMAPDAENKSDRLRLEVLSDSLHQQADWIRRIEQKHSGDSGYSTGGSVAAHCGSPTAGSLSTDSSATTRRYPIEDVGETGALDITTTRLNPAAAVFKSTFDGDPIRIGSPKKMTRTPLTNLFPEATQHPPHGVSAGPLESRSHLDTNQMLKNIVDQQALIYNLGRMISDVSALSEHVLSSSQGPASFLSVPSFNTTESSTFPAAPTATNLAATPMALTMPPPATLNTFPTPVFPPVMNDIGQTNVQNPQSFNTFPGPGVPALVPHLAAGISIGTSTVAPFVPPLQHIPAAPPLFGSDRKVNRPHFPVTQKPRDHDPVKQQQYEAYLEWRKANEPGYHIRCKMRQAQRVIRQQQQQQGRSGDPAWKAIVEKTKAAVGAAAAMAAAEKKSEQELVRQQWKAKVRERSEDSTMSENKKPRLLLNEAANADKPSTIKEETK